MVIIRINYYLFYDDLRIYHHQFKGMLSRNDIIEIHFEPADVVEDFIATKQLVPVLPP